MSAIAALAAIASLIFVQPGGMRVSVDHGSSLSEAQSKKIGLQIADSIWRDFCASSNGRRCNTPSYYHVDISLGNRYCIATIEGNHAHNGSQYWKYAELERYRCYFKLNDPTYYVAVDSPDAPVTAITAK